MDPTRDPRFERARHLAGAELRPEHYTDFQRLLKTLRFGSRFQLLICEFNDVPYREALIARLDDVLAVAKLASARLALAGAPHPDFAAVEAALRGLAAGCDAVHVCGGESWFSPPGDMAAGRWEAFNLRREAIARDVPLRILLWLTTAPIRQLALRAPDLWAWRSGIFSFTLADQPAIPALHPFDEAIDRRSLVERTRRIGELRSALGSAAALPEDLRLGLLDELAELLRSVGELDEALRIRLEEELPVHEKLGNVRSKALTQGQIADILQARGQLDEALRIRLEEQLPVFEKLGDVRSKAVTQGQIADILQARGQLDEALRIRLEEQLPVFEKLGAVREKAVTQGRIADILQARGQLDEALRIRLEEELPVYEKLGDVRSKAVTQGRIADILQARGQLDEALRIRLEEQLPVFEKLGAVREKAVTQGRIADILQARGQLDEALRIRLEDQLPVFEKLGDVREKAVTHFRIASLRLARNEQQSVEGFVAIFESLRQAYDIAARLGIADGLAAVGPLYAQVLARRQAFTPALEVLAAVDEACVVLGDEAGRQQAAALRQQIEAMPDAQS